MDNANNGVGNDSQNVAAKGGAVLLVIGEPFSEGHKTLILGDVTKGFRSWDVEGTGIDINDELAQIANRADLGEEGPNASPYGNQLKEGERVIRHNSENLSVEILVNPQTQTVSLAVKNFLSTATKHKQLIYAGHAFQGTGAWILQDDTYTFNNFSHAFKDTDVGNALRQNGNSTLNIYTSAEGDWSSSHISKSEFSKLLDVKLNPSEKLDVVHGVLQFVAYVSNFVRVRELNELLQSSDVVGNIRFTRPTLYIFPGCQGDSALFGISGFNLLVNGGYSRKACFWDFTRHLDRIDAALMTHLGSDNLYGFKSVLQRKSIENVHPEIGFMYVNASDKIKPLTDADSSDAKEDNLQINLAEEGNKLVQYAKHIGQAPQSCSRAMSGATVEPVNLYHKVGIGSLDMYILNPITDSKELKDFYQQWNQKVANFGSTQQVPLPNTLSVCALLVWRPSDPNDNITRIFFPGNAPQHKVLEGLDKLKSLDILKQSMCTKTSLAAKPAKKPTGLASKPPARSKVSPVSTPRNEVPKRESTPRAESAKKEVKTAAAPKPKPSVPKAKKEDVNKKTMKAPEKATPKKDEKTTKAPAAKASTPRVPSATKSTPSKASTPSKSSTPSKGSAKSSAASTPKGSVSPVKLTSPKSEKKPEVKPESPKAKEPSPAPVAAVMPTPDLVDLTQKSEPEPLFNGGSSEPEQIPEQLASVMMPSEPLEATPAEPMQSLIDVTPESVPEPAVPQAEFGQEAPQQMDKNKMLELGIYDEDEDLEEDVHAQQPALSDNRMPQMFGGMGDSMHQDLMDDFTAPPPATDPMQGSFHADLMSGSIHEGMFDNKQPFDGPVMMENGTNVDDLMSPDDDTSEEIQPQALPEPVAYAPESYGQEPDVIPVISAKEETPKVSEADSTPTAQEPDLLPHEMNDSEKINEDSTLPVEDKAPAMLATPDEVENSLPVDEKVLDIEEKDVHEDLEKNFEVPADIDQPLKESSPAFEHEDIQPVDEKLEEFQPEPVREPSPVDSESDEEFQSQEKHIESEDSKPIEAGVPQPDLLANEEFGDDKAEPEMADEPSFDNQPDIDNDQELQMAQRADSPEIPDVIERPPSPEPLLAEQDQPEKCAEQEIPEPATDEPQAPKCEQEDQMENDVTPNDEISSENDIQRDQSPIDDEINKQPDNFAPEQVVEDVAVPKNMAFEENLPPAMPTPSIVETPVSDEERAESPDSQLGAEDINRDSLEREAAGQKEGSPLSDDDMQRDSMERDSVSREESAEPDQQRDSEERDSIERDSLPRDGTSSEREVGDNSFERSSEERDSIEKEVEPKENHVNQSFEREFEEREVAEVGNDQDVTAGQLEPQQNRETRSESKERSVERSYEDSTEETEEETGDSADDSSSFDQDENTDEKCLISEQGSEEPHMPTGQAMPPMDMENDHHQPMDNNHVGDQQADQHSDMMTSESEYTEDASHGGQVGYHQVDDQDGDSVEGLDDREQFGAPQQPMKPLGDDFDQFGAPAYGAGPMNSNNPFDSMGHAATNPFSGFDKPIASHNVVHSDSEEDEGVVPAGGPASFNPLAEWGEPMGLPSPAPPEEKASKLPEKKSAADTKKPGAAKPSSAASKRPTSATTKSTPTASNGVPDKSKSRLSTNNTSKSGAANTSRLSMGGKTTAASKTRPASAPTKEKSADDLKSKMNGSRRPATATGAKAGSAAAKSPPLPAFTPFYLDLTYIPNHGNPSYSDVEFFKRVRARYYVLSALSPNTQILDSLLEGKNTWEDKSLAVTVIPTYDNETLRLWMTLHKEKLAEAKVEIAPSASRCTIQLQDHETSSSAYRLEF